LKDIENSKLVQVHTALERLDRALTRLESAAAVAPVAGEAKVLGQKLDHLTQAHATLKETAGRVATRLDAAIGRLSDAIEEEPR
jgi:hypothetical protein